MKYCLAVFSKQISLFFILIYCVKFAKCSIGDRSTIYQRCLERCSIYNCTDDGINFKENTHQQPLFLYLTQWTCEDECKYECMWTTIKGFHNRNWRTPQFHGKWPFIRLLGIQEPASVLFSILNGLVHIYMFGKFRKQVRPDSPLRWLWYAFFVISMNTWIWSTIFHTRDLPITEFLDYVSAFSLVLMIFYMVAIRMLRNKVPNFILIIITVAFVTFFIKHVVYLYTKFDYGYNMELNVSVVTLAVLSWLGWGIYNWNKMKHAQLCVIFIISSALISLLELADTPPFLYLIDLHALWHFLTAPLTVIYYRFGIEDCRYLRKHEIELVQKSEKIP